MIYEPIEIYEKLIEDFNSSQDRFVLKFSEEDKEVIDIYAICYDDTQRHIGIVKWDDIRFEPVAAKKTMDGFEITYHEIDISIDELGQLYKFLESTRLQRSEDRFNGIRKQGYGDRREMPVRTVKAFRVWNSIANRYTDLSTEVDPYCNHIYTSYSDGEGLTLNIFIEPCSWRKDMHKNFIYDGDIIEIEFNNRSKVTYDVIFNDGEWIYKNRLDEKNYDYDDMCDDVYTVEIIGNVHTFSIEDKKE